MSIYDTIKDKLNITDIAERYTQLDRAGGNGRVKGLCPLHTEKTPSFFVFPDSQRWHCFGCNHGGDVFDLVQSVEQIDFNTALHELAQQASVELRPLTDKERADQERQRALETIFGVAMTHWQRAIHIHIPNAPGMAYALGRGWTEETIENAGLGYHHDVSALRTALGRAGVDLQHSAAQAVLTTPPGSLIYPHYERGRVVYYAARGITDKRHWNPKQDLVGPRQPFFNHHYNHNSPSVVIVEGQGDAVSLGQLDQAAVALAGTAITDALVKDLKARHKAIYIGVENNPAGQEAARKAAEKFGALCRLVKWGDAKPGYDANDWLLEGYDPTYLFAFLHDSLTWLDILTQEALEAPPEEAQDAIHQVFAALVHLDEFALTRIQADVCDALDLNKSTFTALLKIARMEAGMDQHGRPIYEVIGGQICQRQYDRYGGETVNPLANFACEITEDIVEDDGQNQQRYFTVSGKLADGTPLPTSEVKAEDFAKMTWILPTWGAGATITAGSGTKEHLRAAIQTLSTEVEHHHEYAHLGWRTVDDTPLYLNANGAVGQPDVAVRLPDTLTNYRLPTDVDPAKLPDAIRASLRFMDVGLEQITIPLWAAIYLAPLASILPPAFTVWLFGTTGSMKSTAAALAMCHFGTFSYNLPAPSSWVSDTTYAMRVKSFLCKDAPLWVDDYAKQSSTAGERELRKKAETLLREWGNRSGRSAGQADGSLRTTHNPRGLVISTAEQLPPNPSIHPRLYAVEIHPGDITHGQNSKLTHAQTHDAQLYGLAMAGYVTWLAPQLADLDKELSARRAELTQRASQEMQHMRSPMNVATLYLGWEMGVQYAHAHGVLDNAQRDVWLEWGWETLLDISQQQDAEINREEDPIKIYMESIDHMLLQGSIYMRHRYNYDDVAFDKPTVSNRQPNAAFIGWYDDQYWYLLDQPAYNAVAAFCRAGGNIFPDSTRGVKVKLLEQGMLHPDPSDKYRHRINLGEDSPRVLRIVRTADNDKEE